MNKETGYLWDQLYELQIQQSWNAEVLESLLFEVDNSGASSSEIAVLRGYIAYHFPCPLTSSINIEREFRKALNSNPNDLTARLYLAHYYYDSGEYSASIRELQKVSRQDYELMGQKWRSLKILELLLAARLYLTDIQVQPEEINAFARELSTAGSEDSAIPEELVASLQANNDRLLLAWTSPVFQSVIGNLRKAIDETASHQVLKQSTDSFRF